MTGNSAARGPFPVMVKQAHDILHYTVITVFIGAYFNRAYLMEQNQISEGQFPLT